MTTPHEAQTPSSVDSETQATFQRIIPIYTKVLSEEQSRLFTPLAEKHLLLRSTALGGKVDGETDELFWMHRASKYSRRDLLDQVSDVYGEVDANKNEGLSYYREAYKRICAIITRNPLGK